MKAAIKVLGMALLLGACGTHGGSSVAKDDKGQAGADKAGTTYSMTLYLGEGPASSHTTLELDGWSGQGKAVVQKFAAGDCKVDTSIPAMTYEVCATGQYAVEIETHNPVAGKYRGYLQLLHSQDLGYDFACVATARSGFGTTFECAQTGRDSAATSHNRPVIGVGN